MSRPRRIGFGEPKKHPHPNGKRWWYIDGYTNRRVRLSFFNKSEAMKQAARLNKLLSEQGTQGALSQLSSARMQIAAHCFQLLERNGGNDYMLVQATEEYIKTLTRCRVTKTIDELCASYEQECRRRHEKGEKMSDRNLETIQETLRKFKAQFGEQLICNVRGIDVRNWLMQRELGPRTRNRHLGAICTIFQYAMDLEWLPDNPLSRTKGWLASKTDKVGILTVPQVRTLLYAAHPDLIPYLAIAAFAGIRPGEIARLDWQDVHLDLKYFEVSVGAAKTARRRTVKMEDNLVAWLRPHEKESGSLMPLAQRSGEPSDKRWDTLFREARAKAGVLEDWPHDGLRHSYASHMIVLRDNLAYVCAQLGNSIAILVEHYRESVAPAEAEKYFQIYPPQHSRVHSSDSGVPVITISAIS